MAYTDGLIGLCAITTTQQEVLSLSARLQASNAAALEALGALFPPELFPLPSSEAEATEQEQEQEQPAAASLSVVAEDGEGEEGLSEMVTAVELQLTALDAVARVYADGDQEPSPVLEAVEAEAAEAAAEAVVEDEEQGQDQPEQEAEEAVTAAAAGKTDSPPSMSDLGLSAFTRRFILEGHAATPGGSTTEGAAAQAKAAAAARVAGISPMSASPASPPLPIEKRAAEAAAAAGLGTPVITMPTAGGERAFPSPVFRTGVKVRCQWVGGCF
jgi:hypothetical protein